MYCTFNEGTKSVAQKQQIQTIVAELHKIDMFDQHKP